MTSTDRSLQIAIAGKRQRNDKYLLFAEKIETAWRSLEVCTEVAQNG